jgi:ribonuclease PH
MSRYDGRANNELRPVEIVRRFLKNPEGSVLIRTGDTQVICTATVEEDVPGWLAGTGRGWVTAEYGMLPRATTERTDRYKVTGREHEIQRLIGRSLRAAVDLNRLGERAIKIDCDVIQADGGTRTASITGGFVALCDALDYMVNMGIIDEVPVLGSVAAVSVGVVDGEVLLDLSYPEDSRATVDMNVVMRGDDFVEVQGTGENGVFDHETLGLMLNMAESGIKGLMSKQKGCLSG